MQITLRASTRSVWMLTIFNISLIWRVEARRRVLTRVDVNVALRWTGKGWDGRKRDVTRKRWRHTGRRTWRNWNMCVATKRESTAGTAAGRGPRSTGIDQWWRWVDEAASDYHSGDRGLPGGTDDTGWLPLSDLWLAVSSRPRAWSSSLDMCHAFVYHLLLFHCI